MSKKSQKKILGRKKTKQTSLLFASFLLLVVAVGGTIAFLQDFSGQVKNWFAPSQVTTRVVEELNDKVKSNVKIKNTGNTEAWIRAKVVVTWQDGDGNVYAQAPIQGADKDYSIEYDLNNGWVSGDDGFYYWTTPVLSDDEAPENCTTGTLIKSCVPNASSTAPEGYYLNVEIVGSGIQSTPDSVFDSEWGSSGYKVNDDGTGLAKVEEE